MRDPEQNILAASIWEARPDSFWRMPLCFNPDAWLLTHAICSALWLDLCHEAVRTESLAPAPGPGPQKPSSPAKHSPTRVSLPIRYAFRVPETATWSTPAEVRAIERATSYGCTPTQPAYTFVRPHTRNSAGTPGQEVRIVKSQGLFSLVLCLNERDPNDQSG